MIVVHVLISCINKSNMFFNLRQYCFSKRDMICAIKEVWVLETYLLHRYLSVIPMMWLDLLGEVCLLLPIYLGKINDGFLNVQRPTNKNNNDFKNRSFMNENYHYLNTQDELSLHANVHICMHTHTHTY